MLAGSIATLGASAAGTPLPTEYAACYVGVSVRILAFARVGGESLRYTMKLQRRVPLGLARPIMVHRFLL